MDKTEVRTPRTAPISCPFESVVEGTAKKWRNNSYVPSIKCTFMWSPISLSVGDVIRSGYEFGDRSHITDYLGLKWASPTTREMNDDKRLSALSFLFADRSFRNSSLASYTGDSRTLTLNGCPHIQ